MSDELNKKKFSYKQLDDLSTEIFEEYLQHYQNGKMSFGELVIIENIVIKFQNGLRDLDED